MKNKMYIHVNVKRRNFVWSCEMFLMCNTVCLIFSLTTHCTFFETPYIDNSIK